MGSGQSRKTPESNAKMENIKTKIVDRRIDDIDTFQKYINSDSYHSPNTSSILTATNIAKEQVKRRGKALTKTDLIAIITSLDPSKLMAVYELRSLTVDELNVLIRNIIYDPVKMSNNYNMLQMNGTNQMLQISDDSEILSKHVYTIPLAFATEMDDPSAPPLPLPPTK